MNSSNALTTQCCKIRDCINLWEQQGSCLGLYLCFLILLPSCRLRELASIFQVHLLLQMLTLIQSGFSVTLPCYPEYSDLQLPKQSGVATVDFEQPKWKVTTFVFL